MHLCYRLGKLPLRVMRGSVEVFVDGIEQKGQKFMGIFLGVLTKPVGGTLYRLVEGRGFDDAVIE